MNHFLVVYAPTFRRRIFFDATKLRDSQIYKHLSEDRFSTDAYFGKIKV